MDFQNFLNKNTPNLFAISFDNVDIKQIDFNEVLFFKSHFNNCKIEYCNFKECNLNNTHFENSLFYEVEIKNNNNLFKLELDKVFMNLCYFENLQFYCNKFENCKFIYTIFKDCKFTELEITNTRFEYCIFLNCFYDYHFLDINAELNKDCCCFKNCFFYKSAFINNLMI